MRGKKILNLLELKDVSKYYYTQEVVTLGLRKINLQFNAGEFIAVIGESGSGKSTLMNVISGVDTYEEGEIYYKGEETSCYTASEWSEYRKNNVAFIFQDYNLVDSYTVLQNVELALLEMFSDKKERRKKALSLIDKVDLSSHINHKCTHLSGGQKQRVAIARALAKDTPIIIADEPTGNLDEESSKSIIKLLCDVAKNKLLIMVTHNFDDVAEYATRKIRLYDGSIVEDKVLRTKLNNNEVRIIINKGSNKLTILEKFWKSCSNIFKISVNNIIATPKKSIYLYTTVFLSSMLFIFLILLTSNVLVSSPDVNYNGDRKDTAIVYKNDRLAFGEEEQSDLLTITGVEAAMVYHNAYELRLTEGEHHSPFAKKHTILNIASFNKKALEYGSLPTNDNEILLGIDGPKGPDLSLIGKEMTFSAHFKIDNVIGNSQVGPSQFSVIRTFKVAGYTTGSYCYLSTSAIESISREYDEAQIVNKPFLLAKWRTSSYTQQQQDYFKIDDIIVDSSIPEGEIVLIYNEEEEYDAIEKFYQFYNTLKDSSEEEKMSINSGGYNNFFNVSFNVVVSNSVDNEQYYNNFYDGKIALAVNPADFPYSVEEGKISNSAKIIFDERYKIENTQKLLEDAGYKVIYFYAAPIEMARLLDLVYGIVMSAVLALVLMGLGILMITEIFNKIMATKLKDFNILRTLGISERSIKALTYIEFLIITVMAYLSIILLIIITYGIAILSKSYKIINAVTFLLPCGFYHFTSLNIFLLIFAIVILQTILIVRRFSKRLMKNSIKKSSTIA